MQNRASRTWVREGDRLESGILHYKAPLGAFLFDGIFCIHITLCTKEQILCRPYYGFGKRVEEHKIRNNLGTNDWKVVYTEVFATRAEAMLSEQEIKSKRGEVILSS